MNYRILFACATTLWLAGCEFLPEQGRANVTEEEMVEATVDCPGGVPTFEADACLLPDWMSLGLASQRGDSDWRSAKLIEVEQAPVDSEDARHLARAITLAWGSERQWTEAAELFDAHLRSAPEPLQPLLRYWRNELEGRRAMAGQLSRSQSALAAQRAENEQLAEKLEALTAIEQNINLRQQSP
ncbi:hypothetical protein [Billgrantia montanilacus]|uniref:YfhG lipoprotein n=1 Tax=Billgrantia montanilacus TaxID=2282305 RepID=A0A368TZM2_9GAMM|nr:hypothetical protein [Halomonas montanilacus]RCV90031.1 hypothetical protein DU505_07170 [Halomonas montanilacus]